MTRLHAIRTESGLLDKKHKEVWIDGAVLPKAPLKIEKIGEVILGFDKGFSWFGPSAFRFSERFFDLATNRIYFFWGEELEDENFRNAMRELSTADSCEVTDLTDEDKDFLRRRLYINLDSYNPWKAHYFKIDEETCKKLWEERVKNKGLESLAELARSLTVYNSFADECRVGSARYFSLKVGEFERVFV
jgi:hypothetical protein